MVKETDIESTMNIINQQHDSVKFTFEREINRTLPFLDVKIHRTDSGQLDFDIYRKETSTTSFTPADSHHNRSHKFAAFCSMIHRLKNIPLNQERYNKEWLLIKSIALKNGYDPNVIDRISNNMDKKRNIRNITTLSRIKDVAEIEKVIPVYYNKYTDNALKYNLKKAGVRVVNRNRFKLRALLGTTKDKINWQQKSGIYKIKCDQCKQSYIGQSRRAIICRFKEHERDFRLNHPTKSAVAGHMLQFGHSFNIKSFSLLKEVQNPLHLNAWETYFINNTPNLMNIEDAPLNSLLIPRKMFH